MRQVFVVNGAHRRLQNSHLFFVLLHLRETNFAVDVVTSDLLGSLGLVQFGLAKLMIVDQMVVEVLGREKGEAIAAL